MLRVPVGAVACVRKPPGQGGFLGGRVPEDRQGHVPRGPGGPDTEAPMARSASPGLWTSSKTGTSARLLHIEYQMSELPWGAE